MPKIVVPTGQDNECTVEEYDVAEIQDRHIGPPPPPIDTAFSSQGVPVFPTVSDYLGTYTFIMPIQAVGVSPIRIVEKQPQGVSAKVLMWVRGTSVAVAIAARQERLISPANTTFLPYTMGVTLDGPAANSSPPQYIFNTRSEIWAINVSAAVAELHVIVETYDLDSRMPKYFDRPDQRQYEYDMPITGMGDTY